MTVPVTAGILLTYSYNAYLYPFLMGTHDMNFKSLVPVSIWNRLRVHRVLRKKTTIHRKCAFWMMSSLHISRHSPPAQVIHLVLKLTVTLLKGKNSYFFPHQKILLENSVLGWK